MTFEFKMPDAGPDIETVEIAQILVSEGESIEAGAAVLEVQIDKAVAEIECPQGGTVEKVHVAEGDTVAIGATLLSVSGDAAGNGSAAAAAPVAPSTPEEPPAAAPSEPVPTPAPAAASGSADFAMPSPGDNPAEVVEVLVSVGDTVAKDDVVCLVQTDKAIAELESPYSGTVTAVHVKEGDTKEEGDLLITVELSEPAATPAAPPAPAQPAAPKTAPATSAAPAAPTPTPTKAVSTPPPADDRPPAPAGPATRRLARKMGVDLHAIDGSGPGGRITQEDLEAHVKKRLEDADRGTGTIAAPPLPDFTQFGEIERVKMNPIAKASAQNLSVAWTAIPHVTQHDLADVTELEAARKRYVKSNPDKPKITMTAIMIKAVVSALKAHPNFNASIDAQSNEFILKKYYNIGVAVDTPHGLVVPVIRDCDQKNVLEIAAELTELAGKARDRRLTMAAMTGATFTITNLGGIGGTAFTPIVNYPEVAILGMSRGRRELQLDEDVVIERMMLPLSLSYDHRIINGADAARFIVKLSGSLSNFFELF